MIIIFYRCTRKVCEKVPTNHLHSWMRACRGAPAWVAPPRPPPRVTRRVVAAAKAKAGCVKLERVDRLLSRLGYCPRSAAKQWVKDGRVTVDGTPVVKHDVKVMPVSSQGGVLIDGELLDHPDGLTIVLHKPPGFVCSHDEREGPNVYSLLPTRWQNRNPTVEAVGRLDKDTTGLLILTDDGVLSHTLTSPNKHLWKTYHVEVDVDVPQDAIEKFASGALILTGEKKPCKPALLTIGDTNRKRATLKLTEGRFHQVKRMMRSVGCEVLSLHRARFGDLTLGDTEEGDTFVLSPENLQQAIFGSEDNEASEE